MIVTRSIGLSRSVLITKGARQTHLNNLMPNFSIQALSHQVPLRTLVGARRTIQIQSVPASSQEILNSQRLKRPSSPHFTIYQPQITWILSIANRVTGAGLSLGLYGFLIAYLAAPVAGLSLDSAHIVDFLHGVPEWLKYTAKGIVALPFTFHSINGLRHIAWDLGTFMSVKAVYRTGYTVVAASIVSALALVAL